MFASAAAQEREFSHSPEPNFRQLAKAMTGQSSATVCVVVGSWPRVSTTFIAQELVGLEREGLKLWLTALKPGDPVEHALHKQLAAPVHFVPRYPPLSPAAFARAWRKARRLPGYARARQMFHADSAWLSYGKRAHLFALAIMIAADMPRDTKMIYAHFIRKSGSVARYVAAMAELPLAGSAHARDIWISSDAEMRIKIDAMRWITTCNGPAMDKLSSLTDDPDKVKLIYHGLSLTRFPGDAPQRAARDGSDPNDPVVLLSVGRAVEKKGFDVLLDALATLPADRHWVWHQVGAGKIIDSLKDQAKRLGLNGRVHWHGMRDQAEVIARYRSSDLFVFPARQASDGDQDGLPNVLMEAQTQALCCLSTRFSAIPELIHDGETGILVEPGDAAALAAALQRLIAAPAERERLGAAGYQRVRDHLQAESGIREIADLLRQSMAEHGR
jgi:glycosyltransferase involved in cell wall biosynthesis